MAGERRARGRADHRPLLEQHGADVVTYRGSKPVREAVRRALDEPHGVPSVIPEPKLPTLADECPVCGAELRVYDRSWTLMRTAEGTLASANYCGPACYEESERRPAEVLIVLRRRQRLLRGGSA